MTFTPLLPLLLTLTLTPSLAQSSRLDTPWTAGAWNPSKGWPGTAIQAGESAFWLNRLRPQSYCPDDVEALDCDYYPGDETVFAGGNGTLGLGVGVPGGQQVFITPTGGLSFTRPHSGYIPQGSYVRGFVRDISAAHGAPIVMAYPGLPFYACPATEEELELAGGADNVGVDEDGVGVLWKVVVKVPEEVEEIPEEGEEVGEEGGCGDKKTKKMKRKMMKRAKLGKTQEDGEEEEEEEVEMVERNWHECVPFEWRTYTAEGVSAWEYF